MNLSDEQVKYVASLLTDDPNIIVENNFTDQGLSDDEILKRIDQIVAQPWDKWAEFIDCNVRGSDGRWDDPGEYPSNIGSGPLRSYGYLEDLSASVVFEISQELTSLIDQFESEGGDMPYLEIFEDNLEKVADECVDDEYRDVNVSWRVKRQGSRIIFSVHDFDASGANIPLPESKYYN
jgi:hypothetical protein